MQRPYDVLASATMVNAEILRMKGKLGIVSSGALADLIAVAGNPLEDLTLLQDQGRRIDLIMKNGKIVKLAI